MDIIGIISFFIGVISFILSIIYNNKAKKLNKDTLNLIQDQNRRQDQIYEIVRGLSHAPDKLVLEKDQLLIRKTSTFKNNNIERIIEEFKCLYPIAKPLYFDDISIFLNDKSQLEKEITLRSILTKEDIKVLYKAKSIFSDLGIDLVLL